MNFIECPKCKKEIQEDFDFCPYCKTKIITKKESGENKSKLNKIILCITIISLCLNVFLVAMFFIKNNSNHNNADTNAGNISVNSETSPDINNKTEDSIAQEATDNTIDVVADSKNQELANETTVDNILQEYDIKELIWTENFINATHYHYDFVVTNKSQVTYIVKYDIEYFDESNNVIGSSAGKTQPIAAGSPYYVSAYLEDQQFARAECKITPEITDDIAFNPAYITAEVKNTGVKSKYVASLTNNDVYDYEFTGVNVVFYNGDKIVDIEEVYTNNSDYLLPSGKTITKDFSCHKENDRIEYYVFGRYAD